jgi:hypothetical protein
LKKKKNQVAFFPLKCKKIGRAIVVNQFRQRNKNGGTHSQIGGSVLSYAAPNDRLLAMRVWQNRSTKFSYSFDVGSWIQRSSF